MSVIAAIDAVFCPSSIAVVGASSDPAKFGSQVFRNLQASGFPGALYPISRSSPEVWGIKSVPTLRDLPAPVDLVLLSVPVQHAASAIEDAVADMFSADAQPGGAHDPITGATLSGGLSFQEQIDPAVAAGAGDSEFTITTPVADVAGANGHILVPGAYTWA